MGQCDLTSRVARICVGHTWACICIYRKGVWTPVGWLHAPPSGMAAM